MRKTFIVLFSALSILLIGSTRDYAQFRLSLGPQTGLNFNLHTGSDLSESGNGFGFVIGGTVDMSFNRTLGLITNLQFYDNRSGSTKSEGSNQYQTGNGIISSTVYTENAASLAYFLIEPLLKLSLPNSGMYFLVGPSFGFNIEGSYEYTTTETLPQGYQFDTGQNSITQKSKGSLKDLSARFELKMGAGYNIPIGSGIDLFPQLTFGYGITKVQSDVSWRILTIQALFGVKFNLI
jgi:hypothetical protein